MSDRTICTFTLVIVAVVTIAIGWFAMRGGLGAPLAVILALPILFVGRRAYDRMDSA
jgi:type IV secretory pathway VirB2 component (pilin)